MIPLLRVEEIDGLQQEVEKLRREKRELELETADQAETCRNLQDANNTLSARALALAEEVATAPEAMRIKMEAQLAEVRRQLKEAQEDVDAMRNAEQSQKIALLDELNSTQSENARLRDQLRAAQRK
jgi:chromosome segregation ATPase